MGVPAQTCENVRHKAEMDPEGADDGGSRLVAVKLRLVRMGKKKQPTYRLVAADSRSPRDGKFLELVGTYAPRGRSTIDADAVVTIDHDRALEWLRQGAKPTERVERLLRSAGTFDRLDPATAPSAGVREPGPASEVGSETGGDTIDTVGVSDPSAERA